MPAHCLLGVSAEHVFGNVENYLREATNEPSRREDREAWREWRDEWLERIHDAAEAAATGRPIS